MRTSSARIRRAGARVGTVMAAAFVVIQLAAWPALAQWPQWGGPNRNFTIATAGLADQWPDDGPPRLWKRELGDGYACTIAADGMLFTMYRVGEDEFTVALDAQTGRTRWEHKNHSPYTAQMKEFGPGPHATPLLVGSRLYTVGTNLALHCFDRASGRVLWERDLRADFGGTVPGYGYASSPVAYQDTIILPVACGPVQEQPLLALRQDTGQLIWKNEPAAKSVSQQHEYSSPLIIDVGGQEQLVFLGSERVAGYDPATGELLWSHAHLSRSGVNATSPVWNGNDILFCSAAYDSGARAIRLRRDGGQTTPEELWYSRKMRTHHGNAVVIGDYVYGSSGDFGPAFFMAMNLQTGQVAWRERGFRKATCVHADGKVIILDEDGQLALTTATPDGLTVHSKCVISARYSWAAPTLDGTTLYVRDRQHIMALDVGERATRTQTSASVTGQCQSGGVSTPGPS